MPNTSFELQSKQTSPFFWKRLRFFLSRLFGTRLQKSKGLYFVQLNGKRFKRLTYCDSYQASRIEENLTHFLDTSWFPDLATVYEHEIWVQFVEGETIKEVNEDFLGQFVKFYAAIYTKDPKWLKTEETLFPSRLQQDLHFLGQVGVLGSKEANKLSEVATHLVPEKVWIGFDYTDPVLKNFVLTREERRLCAIDVEGLARDQLIGMGLGKAFALWVGPYREFVLDELRRRDTPDILSYFPFVELCFLAKWVKRSFFEHKWKFVNPKVFEKFYNLS